MRCAAARGDGWCGFNKTANETRVMIDRLTAMLNERGRCREDVEIFMAPVRSAGPESIPAYRDASVDELHLTPVFEEPFASSEDTARVIDEIGRKWVAPAARVHSNTA